MRSVLGSQVQSPPDGPRLLPEGVPASYAAHRRRHGELPQLEAAQLIQLAKRAHLVGRGGAGFPLWRKLETAVAATRSVVVANAAEGEPASAKDVTLLRVAPQLVLDGLLAAAAATGAERTVLYVHEGRAHQFAAQALADRTVAAGDPGIELVAAPARFISGEESALANRVGGGPALPTSAPVYVRGVRGRPTLVSNVETLAHLALLARYGVEWFTALGDHDAPGTMLFSVSTAGAPDITVIEAPTGTPYAQVLAAARRDPAPAALLIGGYHGAWLPGSVLSRRATRAALAPYGASLGAGVAVALPVGACPLVYVAGVLDYLASENAGQCGPCVNGLPALAAAMRALTVGGPVTRVQQLVGLVEGRGGCHHPDGSARLVRSTLAMFPDDLAAHAQGRCAA